MVALNIFKEDPESPDGQVLIRNLEANLYSRYPADSIHLANARDFLEGRGHFWIARLEMLPVGCGALINNENGIGEIKRMFVEPQFRGRGIARRILAFIEEEALALGFHKLRLETGTLQPEAIRLYQSAGYRQIERFGEYTSDPLSLCFEKLIMPCKAT